MISIKIKNPLLTHYSRYVSILDFNPERLSIKKVCAINDNLERIYNGNMMNIIFISLLII